MKFFQVFILSFLVLSISLSAQNPLRARKIEGRTYTKNPPAAVKKCLGVEPIMALSIVLIVEV